MNDAVTIETQQTTAITVLPAASLPTIMGATGAPDILEALVKELAGFVADPTTERGRKDIASKAYRVARAKQDLIRLGDTLKEDAQKTIKGVNAELKVVETRMNELRDQVRRPLDEFEAMEAARVQSHRAAIADITTWGTVAPDWTATQIAARIEELSQHPHRDRDWQEFREQAQVAARNAFNALKVAKQEATEREAAAAEAARVAAEEAAKRQEQERREREEREARIATEAAERARQAAEAEAARKAAEAEAAAQRERDAAAEREQRQVEALAAAEQRERDAEAALKRAAEAAEKERAAQVQREAAAAERARQEEHRRQEAETAAVKAEEERRAANRAHRAQINREALAAITPVIAEFHPGNAEEGAAIARAVIEAIARGAVPHVAISY